MLTHALSWRAPARALLVLLALAGMVFGTTPAASASPRTAAEEAGESILLEMHQRARTAPHEFTGATASPAPPLEAWTDLRDSARRWSTAMAQGRCPGGAHLCHNTTANGGPGYVNELCCWSRAGENVGWTSFTVAGSRPTDAELRVAVRQLMRAYMGSAVHRGNILDPGFGHLGASLALVDAGQGRWRLHSATVFRQHDGSPIDGEPIEIVGSPNAVTLRSPTTNGTCREVPKTRFPDLDPRSTVGVAAGCLGDRDITHGRPDGTFGPAGNVSRAQMASFLVRLLDQMGRPAPTASTSPFRDVSGPHAGAIARLHAAGIVHGVDARTYAGADGVTRGQMASFLARTYAYAANQQLPVGSATFRDVASSTHRDNILRLAEAGIAAGTGSGSYSPARKVTRGQMALFLTRLLDHHEVG
jgi:uncharacterized protein YkwD